MKEIWKYHNGYSEAREKVKTQSLEDDLRLINDLFGRDNLKYRASPEDVKQEALRQLEIEWRSERNTLAEISVSIIEHQMSLRK